MTAVMADYQKDMLHREIAVKYGCSETTIGRRIAALNPMTYIATQDARAAQDDDPNDPDLPWQSRGLCNDFEPNTWFDGITEREAKYVCGMCKVATICLEDALATREKHGVRGGHSPAERRRILRRRDRDAQHATGSAA
jgi:hypothetical protein